MKTKTLFGIVTAVVVAAAAVRADEGMYLFTDLPRDRLEKVHNFKVTDAWLDHLQKASVRFGAGGSASFVSPDGLVMTNHHVGRSAIAKLGGKEKDLVRDGYYAKNRDAELKCPDVEVMVLQSVEDVTAKVNAAVKAGTAPAEAEKARRAVMNTLEKESKEKTGLQSEVVTLYQGGLFHLYRYKRYADVRLVWAPEQQIAHFGGDPDNFEYPRYCLDAAFFRVYEDGKPAKVEHYLKWSEAGAKDGDLAFVSGHPGRTNRLNTVAHLQFFRDRLYPLTLSLLRRWEVNLKTYADRSPENERRAHAELYGVQNSRKAYLGMLGGLQDPAVLTKKRAAEAELRAVVGKDEKLRAAYGGAWDEVGTSLAEWEKLFVPFVLLEGSRGTAAAFNSALFGHARTLVRLADESAKPNADRLREYRESNLESLKQRLFSPAPIYDDLETVKLADSLALLQEMAAVPAPSRDWEVSILRTAAVNALAGKSPRARAAELVAGTKLRDAAFRKALADGGRAAIDASDDPLIRLAREVDLSSREVRKAYEEKVAEPQQQAYAKIANALFAAKGKDAYPDATFSLRLAFGPVKGYQENGKAVAALTDMAGAFEHAASRGGKPPFDLPPRWVERKDLLDLKTPFNFVCTADIIGGNSGSPVVNRQGEVIGLIFDGNIQSLTADFQYTDEQGRAVAVHSRAIVEALRKVYDAGALADELTGRR